MSSSRLTCLGFLKIHAQVFWPLVFQLLKVPGFTSLFKNKIGFGFAINVSLANEPTSCSPSTPEYRKIPSPTISCPVSAPCPQFSWLFTDDSWATRWQLCPRRQAKPHGYGWPGARPRCTFCSLHTDQPLSGISLGTFWPSSLGFLLEASVSSQVTGEHRENVNDRMPDY